MRVWSITGTLHRTVPTSRSYCGLTISPNGKLLAIATEEGVVEVWAAE